MGTACCSRDPEDKSNAQNQKAPLPLPEQFSIEPHHLELSYDSEQLYTLIQQLTQNYIRTLGIPQNHENQVFRLVAYRQHELLLNIQRLINVEQDQYFKTIFTLDLDKMDIFNHHLKEKREEVLRSEIKPSDLNTIRSGELREQVRNDYYDIGLSLIRGGEVGLVIFAAGKNLRMGIEGRNKGCYEFQLGNNQVASLFGIITERIKGVHDQYSIENQKIMIICSSENKREIEEFWRSNHNFKFATDCVLFFEQPNYQWVDKDGHIKLKTVLTLWDYTAPCCDFMDSIMTQDQIKTKFSQALRADTSLKLLHFIGLDNLMVKPLDPIMIGYSLREKFRGVQKAVRLDDNRYNDFSTYCQIENRLKFLSDKQWQGFLESQEENQSELPVLNANLVDFVIVRQLLESSKSASGLYSPSIYRGITETLRTLSIPENFRFSTPNNPQSPSNLEPIRKEDQLCRRVEIDLFRLYRDCEKIGFIVLQAGEVKIFKDRNDFETALPYIQSIYKPNAIPEHPPQAGSE